MRIWTLHPRFLDRQGLLGQWREALQAKNALLDPHHSSNVCHERQLRRFKAAKIQALSCMGVYLHAVADEMILRGYKPNVSLIPYYVGTPSLIPVTQGQVNFEIAHLMAKLTERDPSRLLPLSKIRVLMSNQLNPIFKEVGGDIESWEKIS